MVGRNCYRLGGVVNAWPGPTCAGIDTVNSEVECELQIKRTQDWERGLKGGETEGSTGSRLGAPVTFHAGTAGIDVVPSCAVIRSERNEVGVSLIDPCRSNIELTQQSGSDDEGWGLVLPQSWQQFPAWPGLGAQKARSPATWTRKTASTR